MAIAFDHFSVLKQLLRHLELGPDKGHVGQLPRLSL
jgi:hypothetical protein